MNGSPHDHFRRSCGPGEDVHGSRSAGCVRPAGPASVKGRDGVACMGGNVTPTTTKEPASLRRLYRSACQARATMHQIQAVFLLCLPFPFLFRVDPANSVGKFCVSSFLLSSPASSFLYVVPRWPLRLSFVSGTTSLAISPGSGQSDSGGSSSATDSAWRNNRRQATRSCG